MFLGTLSLYSIMKQVLSLILSDVIEDKLDIISSGPTAPLLTSPRQCLQILDRLIVKVNQQAIAMGRPVVSFVILCH